MNKLLIRFVKGLMITGCLMVNMPSTIYGAQLEMNNEIGKLKAVQNQAQQNAEIKLSSEGHTEQEIREKYEEYKAQYIANDFSENPVFTYPQKAGKLNEKVLENGLNAVNFIRYVAGLPDEVTLNEDYNRYAQYGATLLAYMGYLEHKPGKPVGTEQNFYQLGYKGTSSCNIAQGYGTVEEVIYDQIFDRGTSNLSSVGHRRWILNPGMKQTGIGLSYQENKTEYKYMCLYALDGSRDYNAVEYDFIAWPARGAFPIEFIKAQYSAELPWSISLNPTQYDASKTKEIQVTMTNVKTGTTWKSNPSKKYTETNNEEYFNISTQKYGVPYCIIFRPHQTVYSDGDLYKVEVSGVYEKGKNSPTTITYTTTFFELEKEDEPNTVIR